MKEIELQKMICDVVNARGGFARKLSNRFLIGVADLVVKLPSSPMFFLEVKQRDLTNGLDEFKLDVTKLQRDFLLESWSAGVHSGVASFVQKDGRRHLWFRAFRLDSLMQHGFTVRLDEHVELGDHKVRDDKLFAILQKYV